VTIHEKVTSRWKAQCDLRGAKFPTPADNSVRRWLKKGPIAF
jgi:hypothetical protein